MNLRYPCEHGVYDKHHLTWLEREALAETGRIVLVSEEIVCPGGVFLPDDTLIIEKVQCGRCIATPGTVDVVAGFADCPACHGSGRVWPDWASFGLDPYTVSADQVLDALSVREDGETP